MNARLFSPRSPLAPEPSNRIYVATKRESKSNKKRNELAAKNRAAVLSTRPCKHCGGPIPPEMWDSVQRWHCSSECHREARRKRERDHAALRKRDRGEHRAVINVCRGCAGQSWRCETFRDSGVPGPCWKCGAEYAPEVIEKDYTASGPSMLARAQDFAPGYVGTWSWLTTGKDGRAA